MMMIQLMISLAFIVPLSDGRDHTQMTNEEKIAQFEHRITVDSDIGKVKIPIQSSDIGSYTRFYIIRPDDSVMAVYKKPTSGVDKSLYDGKSHVVENFSMLPVGGNCSNTLYVSAKQFPIGDYSLTCGAR